MTRINVGVKPKELTDKHLLAEHREIKRIPNTIKSGKARIKNIPTDFRLGKGHVKFFYNKLTYLLKRYREIHDECIKRGFKVKDYSQAWDGIYRTDLFNDWEPTEEDRAIIVRRINERLHRV